MTDPEIAHAGLTEAQAREVGGGVETTTWPTSKLTGACGGRGRWGVKLVHRVGTVASVTIVSPAASELVQEWIYVLDQGLKTRDVATGVHVYPTWSWANAQVAGELPVGRPLEGTCRGIIRPVLSYPPGWVRWRRSF